MTAGDNWPSKKALRSPNRGQMDRRQSWNRRFFDGHRFDARITVCFLVLRSDFSPNALWLAAYSTRINVLGPFGSLKSSFFWRERAVFRRFAVTVVVVLAVPGQSRGAVDIWLSTLGTTSNSFPSNPAVVPVFQPYLGGSGSIFIW